MATRGGRRWARGAGLAMAVVALAGFLVGGCRTVPGKGRRSAGVDADRLTALLDADTAFVVVEWVPGPPVEEGAGGEELARRQEACRVLAGATLGFLGIDISPSGGGESADRSTTGLETALSRVARLSGERRLFIGSVFYGLMIAPPLDGMDLPSAADVLVARTTRDGREALAGLLDALARRFPGKVRALDGTPGPVREWEFDVAAWKGTARVRLDGDRLRAAFGGGSLAGEADRLLAGIPAGRPLGGVLPPALRGTGPGRRFWVRPPAVAEIAREWVDDVFRQAVEETEGGPGGTLLRTFGGQLAPWVERLIRSIARIRGRYEGIPGWQEIRLSEDPDPVIRLWHDAEGTITPELLAGVPADVPVHALALPPLDRLAIAVGEALSPEAASLVKAFLAMPVAGTESPTSGEAFQAVGPGLAGWDEPGPDGHPGETRGFVVDVRDEKAFGAALRAAALANGGGEPVEEDGVLVWRLSDGESSRTILLGKGLLVSSGSEETAWRVLSRRGGLGDDPAFRAALAKAAGEHPVRALAWTPPGRPPAPVVPRPAGEEDVKAFLKSLGWAFDACRGRTDLLPAGTRGVLSIGMPVPGGVRGVSVPVAGAGEER